MGAPLGGDQLYCVDGKPDQARDHFTIATVFADRSLAEQLCQLWEHSNSWQQAAD